MRRKGILWEALITVFILTLLPPQPAGAGVSEKVEAQRLDGYREVYLPEKGIIHYVAEETRAPTTLDISVHIPGTEVISTGLSSWGAYSLGVVGETVTFRTQAVNHGEVPAYNVTAVLTIYVWNGAGRIDGGKVVWGQRKETYVPPGDGSLSEPLFFNWTPRISGPYIVNITFELMGDGRPRDNSAYYVGAVYEVGGKRSFSGVWIDRWADSLEGATEITSLPAESWKRVSMPPLPTTGEHSSPTVFYCGSLTNLTSNYDPSSRILLLPSFDLRELPCDYFDPLFLVNRPQAYLGYRFLGEVGAGGRLINLISVDGGPFEPLLDPLGNPVVIDLNTSSGGTYRWLYPTHYDIFGNSFYPGIDLSRYAGHWVRVAIEYMPGSQENGSEMGYFLDDFILFLRESYESFTFRVSPEGPQNVRLYPGGSTEVAFTIQFTRVKETLPLKVSTSCPCPHIGVSIEPEVIKEPQEGESVEVTVSFSALPGTPPGTHTVEIAFAGGGWVVLRDVNLTVPMLESISFSGGGEVIAPPEGMVNLTAEVHNTGNVPVSLRVVLFLPPGFSADHLKELYIQVGETRSVHAKVTYGTRPPGNYTVIWLIYPADLGDVEGLGKEGALEVLRDSGRTYAVFENSLSVGRVRNLYFKLLVPSMLVRYEEAPGRVRVPYILINRGNAYENVSLKLDPAAIHPQFVNLTPLSIKVPPGKTVEGDLEMVLNGTYIHGTYRLYIQVTGGKGELLGEESFYLTVHNVKLSSTLYDTGSVSVNIIPREVIRGRETLLVINATRTYPIETEEVVFKMRIALGGAPYAERTWTLTSANLTLLKWIITFREAGRATIFLDVAWRVLGETFSLTSPPLNLTVHRINVKVEDIFLISEEGSILPLEGNIREGSYILGARIRNTGDSAVKGFKVVFYFEGYGQRQSYTVNVTMLGEGEGRQVTAGEVRFTKNGEGKILILVKVDPEGTLYEEDLSDNTMQRRVGVVEARESSGVQTTRYVYFTLVVIIVVFIVAITLRMVRRIMGT